MMKLAIPVFGDRVAPVFDWCRRMLVVEIDENNRELGRNDVDLAGVPPANRPEKLGTQSIDTLLCGGISMPLARLIEIRSIRVLPWVAGEVDTVITAFLSGSLPNPQFMMPGCPGRRFRRGPRRGRGRRGLH